MILKHYQVGQRIRINEGPNVATIIEVNLIESGRFSEDHVIVFWDQCSMDDENAYTFICCNSDKSIAGKPAQIVTLEMV